MSYQGASPGNEDLQGTSIGRQPLPGADDGQDEQQRYHIVSRIGEGGFGAVYSAIDTLANHRRVAIKIIHLAGLNAQQIIEATDSFNREVKLLTTLRHPLLPRVYDHFTDASHWYMVMDFIEGETLDTYLEHRRHSGSKLLPLEDVLNIARQLCDVLDYLHSHEPPVIFRDLKPGNIMLSSSGQLHLIDFGIARHFKPGKAKDTIPLGSPGYAAPEQYGKAQTSASADIYSLGALLHYMLSGRDPADDPFNFAALPPELGGLGTRIMQMLARDLLQRPQSIASVKRIIDSPAYTHGLPPLATASQRAAPSHPATSSRRQPKPAAQRRQQQVQAHPQRSAASLRKQRRMYARPKGRRSKGALTRHQAIVSFSLIGGASLVGLGFVTRPFWQDRLVLPGTTPIDADVAADTPTPKPQLPGDLFHTHYIYEGHQAAVSTVTWSPDSSLVASGNTGPQPRLLVWHPISGKTTVLAGHKAAISQVAWSPNAQLLASASYDHTLRLWHPISGRLLATYRAAYALGGLSWSPDGTRIAVALNDNQMQVWSMPSGNLLTSYNVYRRSAATPIGQRCVIAWHPAGQSIASATHDATVQIWSASSGQTLSTFGNATLPITALSWSPDGHLLAFCSGQLFIWQPATSHFDRTTTDGCTCLAWSPNSKLIAYGQHNQVQVIEAATGRFLFTYRGHTDTVQALAWSPDSKWLASGSIDQTVRIWSLDTTNIAPSNSFVPTMNKPSNSR